MINHKKVRIHTDGGQEAAAIAPVIISASRSTDIPAFYAKWFFNRLREGHCAWVNPFNRKRSYVSFANARAIVFWTKNPAPILPYLNILEQKGMGYYFQFTLNDYEWERLEPNVPPLQNRVETFRKLARRLGPERVIWRFDPIILMPSMTAQNILYKIWNIGNAVKGMTRKLVFSFVDIGAYKKVQTNLVNECPAINSGNLPACEPNAAQRQEIVTGLVKMRNRWRDEGWNLDLAACGETIDLSQYGINHNRCIDGELLARLFPGDTALLHFLRGKGSDPASTRRTPAQGSFFDAPEADGQKGESSHSPLIPLDALKDKGQRPECGCALAKDIGMYNTCRHFCVYCYANGSRKHAARNAAIAAQDQEGESLLPDDRAFIS